MRIDYFHTGNNTTELFSLDEVVIEPLSWPGNPNVPIDTTLRGKFLFEIQSQETGLVVYSRSYSSIYGEWETTGEARAMNRTFHESVRFPQQVTPFKLIIKKRDSRHVFQQVWELNVDPEDILIHRESAPLREQVIPVYVSGDPQQKVDLLILGDGYTAMEKELFLQQVNHLTEVFFNTSPFKERKNDFNVWALMPVADQSGVSRPSEGLYRDTPLGTSYDAFRSERYILTYDNKAFRQIASSAPYDFIEIIVNSETYGGGGIYGLYSTAAAGSDWDEYLFIHEFGHHFAGLADEYYTSSVAYELPDEIIEPYEPNVTALHDPENLKWKHLVNTSTPVPTPWPKQVYEEQSMAYQQERAQLRANQRPEAEMNALFARNRDKVQELFSSVEHKNSIGAFEGGNYQAQGIYRSALNCAMFERNLDFCQVCSEAIEVIIDSYSR